MLIKSVVLRQFMYLLSSITIAFMLLGIFTTNYSYASSGHAHFTIEPTFLKPYNVKPRGYFIYDTVPGAYIFDRLHVTNDGSARGRIHLYASDATTAPTSGTTFLPENAPRRDVGAWIILSQQEVTLDPGQSEEVPFRLTIPNNVRPGQHGGLIIAEDMSLSSILHSTSSNSVHIGIQSSLALGVLVNLPGLTTEKLQTDGISYDEKSQYQRLLVVLENSGTQLLYPSGYLQVLDERGTRVQNVNLQLNTFVPRTLIAYPVYIQHKQLLPGKRYTAKLYLQYGHGYSLKYEQNFVVPLADKSLVSKVVQTLGSPVLAPSTDTLSGWQYVLVAVVLFLALSSALFWGQKIYKWLHKKP